MAVSVDYGTQMNQLFTGWVHIACVWDLKCGDSGLKPQLQDWARKICFRSLGKRIYEIGLLGSGRCAVQSTEF